MSAAQIIEVADLEVRYNAMRALDNVSLVLRENEITVLLGSNGAGKSSLLKAIAGSVKPRAGTISFRGEQYQGKSADYVTRRGVVLVPEGRRIFADFTVEENLRIGALTRPAKADIAAQTEFVLGLFPDLADRMAQEGGTLSGGQQQMLAIARALMSKPSVLLLDEPSLGVSPKLTLEIYAALASLGAQGTTILLVEQYATLALGLASYGYVIKNGSVALEGTAEDLRGSDEVRAAYLSE